MEANILIKILDDIDSKLSNQTYKEKVQVVGKLSGQLIDLPDKTIHRFSAQELISIFKRKRDIIESLYRLGIVDEEGYKEYFLSENPQFTPKLNLSFRGN
jgi:hypothetical protein